ncbi:MAG: hypothetical protein HYS45_01025 [Parcubacteria group bacterium]|nr:hypothetical protein [Parcubacteria group bacterium]
MATQTQGDTLRDVTVAELMEHPEEAIRTLKFRWLQRDAWEHTAKFRCADLPETPAYAVGDAYMAFRDALVRMGAVNRRKARERLEFEVVTASGMRVVVVHVSQLRYICRHSSWRTNASGVYFRPSLGDRLPGLMLSGPDDPAAPATPIQRAAEELAPDMATAWRPA